MQVIIHLLTKLITILLKEKRHIFDGPFQTPGYYLDTCTDLNLGLTLNWCIYWKPYGNTPIDDFYTDNVKSLAAFVYLIWTDTLQSAWLMSQMSVEWWIYILHDGHCNCSARNLTELISFSQSLLGKWLSSWTVQEACKSSSACFLFKGCKVIDQSSMFSCKQANGPAILPIPHTDYQSKHSINSQRLFPWYLCINHTIGTINRISVVSEQFQFFCKIKNIVTIISKELQPLQFAETCSKLNTTLHVTVQIQWPMRLIINFCQVVVHMRIIKIIILCI